jgi:hypothetical protein
LVARPRLVGKVTANILWVKEDPMSEVNGSEEHWQEWVKSAKSSAELTVLRINKIRDLTKALEFIRDGEWEEVNSIKAYAAKVLADGQP